MEAKSFSILYAASDFRCYNSDITETAPKAPVFRGRGMGLLQQLQKRVKERSAKSSLQKWYLHQNA
jgi:hypothetical protein